MNYIDREKLITYIAITVLLIVLAVVIILVVKPFGKDGTVSKDDVKTFNEKLEKYNGEQDLESTKELVELVIENNNTNSRKVVVSYNFKTTSTIEELDQIKRTLCDKKYEISFLNDATAYIQKVNIKIIE